jgi:hypothetical protein
MTTPTPDERFAAAVQALIDESYRDGRRQHTTLGSKARAEVIALYEAKVKECEKLKERVEIATTLAAANQRDACDSRDNKRRAEAAERDTQRIEWLARQRGIEVGSWPKTSHVAGYGWCGTVQASTMREAIDRAASKETFW